MSQCHHKHLIIQAFLLEPKSKTEVLMDKFHAEKFLRRNEPVTFPIKFSIFITFRILSTFCWSNYSSTQLESLIHSFIFHLPFGLRVLKHFTFHSLNDFQKQWNSK